MELIEVKSNISDVTTEIVSDISLDIQPSSDTEVKRRQHQNVACRKDPWVSIKARMKRFFGLLSTNKRVTDKVNDSKQAPETSAPKTVNLSNTHSKPSRRKYITTDVPTDISPLKRSYESALIQLTSLTDEQIEEIRSTWKFLKNHIEKIGVVVYLGLFEEHSDFRDAFAAFRGRQLSDLAKDPAVQSHGLRVLTILDKIISRLHKIELMQDAIFSIASKHCKYVPSITMIPCVGEQLLDAIRPVLEEQSMWNEATSIGWNSVITYLTSSMRYGLARTQRPK